MKLRYSALAIALLSSACMSPRDRARADSVQLLAKRQQVLMEQLVAQRDSVARVVTDADMFIGRIDSSISRVKGLGPNARTKKSSEGPLEDQLAARKDMLRRVDALSPAPARQRAPSPS